MAAGACSTTSYDCSYQVSTWPAGRGGKAFVAKDLSWLVFGTADYGYAYLGDLVVRAKPANTTAPTILPSTVPLDYSQDGGRTWSTFSLPTGTPTTSYSLAGIADVQVTGQCDLSANICSVHVTGPVVVTAKPWGSPQGPECSGFTPGQLSVLDFSKMDLSEWTASITPTISASSGAGDLVSKASAQFEQFNSRFSAGQVQSTAPVSSNFARIAPTQGFGPFDVRLVVAGYWPETSADPAQNVDAVQSVMVDWGDCSAPETLLPVSPSDGVGFRGTHRYVRSDTYACLGSPSANVTHGIKITALTSKSGKQKQTLSVQNAWSNFSSDASAGANAIVPIVTTISAPKK